MNFKTFCFGAFVFNDVIAYYYTTQQNLGMALYFALCALLFVPGFISKENDDAL